MTATTDDLRAFSPHGDGELGRRSRALLDEQLAGWPLLRDNVNALSSVRTRTVPVDGFVMKVQFNPARIASTGAAVDLRTIRKRRCFLCRENLPREQRGVAFNDHYVVLANPFPIFPEHFTIPHRSHRPQRVAAGFRDLLDLARAMAPRYTAFYNGPKCGASAPDHLHFQAGDRGFMPIEAEYDRLKGQTLVETSKVRVYAPRSLRPFVSIESGDRAAAVKAFHVICAELATLAPADDEPMMNVLAWHEGDRDAGEWRVVVLPRARHRPSFFHADGEEKILLSPGSVDLGGVCITPMERDFDRLTPDHLRQMLLEVMMDSERFDELRKRLCANVAG